MHTPLFEQFPWLLVPFVIVIVETWEGIKWLFKRSTAEEK